MALSKPKNPFRPAKRASPLTSLLLSPVGIGTVTASVLAVSPRVLGREVPLLKFLPTSMSRLPHGMKAALVGFSLGYVACLTASWLHGKVTQRLLAYQGWVQQPKSTKTKMWALLLKLFAGSQPKATYDFQRYLPNQPLPDLDHTLDLWLEVASNIVNTEDYEHTKEAVERFRKNEGPILQRYLQERCKKTVNWLSEYWMTAAYMSSRESLAIHSNYYLVNKKPDGQVNDSMARASGCIHALLSFYELVSQSKLPPVKLNDFVPLCMNGYRYIYNSLRMPGENIDYIQRYPGEHHIIVIRNGNYYKMDAYVTDKQKAAKKRIMTTEEIRVQLQKICQHADSIERQQPVAVLTSQNRTKWAKQREQLLKHNPDTLKAVESAMFILSLDETSPKDIHEHCKMTLTGNGANRWFDKSFTAVIFPTSVFGCNVEHSGVDAMVFCTLAEFLMVHENDMYENGNIKLTADGPNDNLSTPLHMEWDLNNLKNEIKQASEEHQKQIDNLDMYLLNTKYGKGFMKKARLSPDGYIQMALQLAYHRLHKEMPKTYEPSTGRLYALGRTENIHPAGQKSKAWVNVMDDVKTTRQSRQELLRRAVTHQTGARLKATIGQGCDRHLLGLYCASRELEMDIPGIYLDKAWQADFKLSTSQTPTRTLELGAEVNLAWVTGGFGPSCPDGYGISYMLMGENLINVAITSWKQSEETSSAKMATAIDQAFVDMKDLFVN